MQVRTWPIWSTLDDQRLGIQLGNEHGGRQYRTGDDVALRLTQAATVHPTVGVWACTIAFVRHVLSPARFSSSVKGHPGPGSAGLVEAGEGVP